MRNLKYPKRYILELSNRCNISCIMCAREFKQFTLGDMSNEFIVKLSKYFPYANEIALFGWGESLLNPQFSKILSHISKFDVKTYLLTNGILLDKYAENIVENRLTYLGISLDAANKDDYEKIRKKSDFDKLIENIKYINRVKEEKNSIYPHIRFASVLMKSNIDKLKEFIDLATSLKITELKFIYLNSYDDKTDDLSLFYSNENVEKRFYEAKVYAEEKNIKLILPKIVKSSCLSDDKNHENCLYPFEEMFISHDLKVRSCIIGEEIFGDFKKQNLDEIWNSKEYNDFRKLINTEYEKEYCKNCYQNRKIDVNSKKVHFPHNLDILE